MLAVDLFDLVGRIDKASPGSKISTWVSHADYEEIKIKETDGAVIEINYYPKG